MARGLFGWLRAKRAVRSERERPFAVASAIFGPTALVGVERSPDGLRSLTMVLDPRVVSKMSSAAERHRAEIAVARALGAHMRADWDLQADRVTFTRVKCPLLAYGSLDSLLEERVRLLALSVVEDLSLLRQGRKAAELVIDEQAIEGIEHVLEGLARGDLQFVSVRAAQLVRGVRASIAASSSAVNA